MSVLSKPYFHDEKAAFAHLESVLWPQGAVCPHCGSMSGKHYDLSKVRSKPSKKNPEGVARTGLRKCSDCRKQFTVKVGTVFEHARLPLHKMLQAVYLMTSSKKGISAHQLHRILEVQYKSAWFLAHRIREAMRSGELAPMGGAGGSGIVEVDETYIGHKKGESVRAGFHHKMPVLSLVERGGSVRSFHIEKTTLKQIMPVLQNNIAREAAIMTDEARHYKSLSKRFASHDFVRHGIGEYGRGMVHTNTIEGYFSIFKRGMRGVYQHCGEKHLHRYLAEFDFRYNNRSKLGVEDGERAYRALNGVKGKRLYYREPE